jgi:beta-phosphoglucomutase-like phosphatase (HAD superfamily)
LDACTIIPALGPVSEQSGFIFLEKSSDGLFQVNDRGVKTIVSTGDRKVEFIAFEERTIALVKSGMNYPAYYPVNPTKLEGPVKAVLMDLDGTSVRSEAFWIWIIEQTVASVLKNSRFELEESDIPYVSGHSVSEHLRYCINKYCPDASLEEAKKYYFKHTQEEMTKITEGRGRQNAFTPTPGLREFLLELKERDIKIGLVTSGLYEKAWPEILSAFRTLDMGDPKDFYDVIISAGFPLRKGSVGTLGELSPKPHPWLYAETCSVGLGIGFEDRNSVIGIEDSGAGICSIRLAGFPAIGLENGNIKESGTLGLCNYFCKEFDEILKIIDTVHKSD